MTGDAMRDVIAEVVNMYLCDGLSDASSNAVPDEVLAAITAAPASARLALARAITPDTHAVVPVEATRAMLEAAAAKGNEAYRLGSQHGADDEQIYDAMIAAARGADAERGK